MNEILLKIVESQGRMESKLDTTLAAIAEHEGRIKRLEKIGSRFFGAFTLIGTAATVCLKILFTSPTRKA